MANLIRITFSVLAAGLVVASGAPCARAAEAGPMVNYKDHVRPIFAANCLTCHNPDKNSAGLDLTTYQNAITGSSGGAVITPGDPDASYLWLVVSHQEEPNMPPNGSKLAERDLETIRQWIAGGAPESASSVVAKADKPKAETTIVATPGNKPDGAPAMPVELPLDPIVQTDRAGAPTAIATSPWAPLVAIGGQGQVLLYHTDTAELLGILPFAGGMPRTIRFSRNGSLLLAGGGEGARTGFVTLYDVVTGRAVATVGEEYDEVLDADIRSDHAHVALGGPGKVVKVYATGTGELVHRKEKHTDWVTAVRYAPDGVLLATGDRNGGLVVWEAASGNEFHVLEGHKAAVTDLAFRPDGNLLISAGEDGAVKLWDMNDGRQVKSWDAHEPGVLSVDVTQDGRIVTCGRDKTVRLWNADGGQVRDFDAFGDIALHAALTHDGQRIIAGDFTGELRVLNAADGQRLAQLDLNPPTVAERIAQAESRVAELNPKRDEALAALNLSERQAAEAAALLQQARAPADEARKAVVLAQTKRDEATTSLASATDAMHAAEQDVAGKQATLDQLTSATTQPTTMPADEVNAAREALASARRALEERQSQMNAARRAAEDAQSALTRTEVDEEAAADAVAKHEERAKAAAEALAQAKQAADAASAELASAVSDRTKWQAAGVRSSLAKARQELDQLIEREQRFIAAMAQVNEFERLIAEAPQKIEAAEQRVAQAKESLAAATASRDATAAALAERDAVEQQAKDLADHLQALAGASPDDAALSDAARAARQSRERLVADRDAKTQATEATVAAAQEQLSSAEAELAQARSEAESSPARLAEARQAAMSAASEPVVAAQAKLEALRAEYDRLRTQTP